MINIKYNKQRLFDSLEPGLTALVIDSFEKKLEEKLDKIVEDVYSELREELPHKIKTSVNSVFTEFDGMDNVNITVDLTG